MPPPVAVMVIVWLPVEALLLALKVTVELPDPGAAIEVGLKVAVTPVGRPLAESEIAELKPPATVVVTLEVLEPPRATETEVGEAETVKLAETGAVTVSETVVVCVTPPPVPVTVMEYVPVAVVEATVRVKVEVPDPGAAIEVGLNAAVTPVGRPLADKATAASKPSTTAVVIVEAPLLPCTTDMELGEPAMVKVGV